MNTSPIIDEIRNYREAHARSFGFDLKRIAEDIRRTERKLREEGCVVVVERAKMNTSVESRTAQ